MRRREFIRKAGLATAGAFAVPYILPSGRLFASSGIRKVNHVVFCMFAGGVRNLEAVDKSLGNLMPYMLSGSEAIAPDIAAAISLSGALPPLNLGYNLQSKGTLFKEFRYAEGPTGHFNGHTTAITGKYTTADLNIKDHPHTPTIFELYRKHNSPAQTARKCWWVSNTLGPYPALNFSTYGGYGAAYGANFIAPTYMFSDQGYNSIGTLKTFSSAEEAAVNNMRTFMNHNFNKSYLDGSAGVANTEMDTIELQNWINDMFTLYHNHAFDDPWMGAAMNNDMKNIFFAEKIIDQFAPELLVVNMQDVDVGHFNFTNYAVNLNKADYAVAHLWRHIQSGAMANDTVMIIAPEHGRNLNGNSSVDANGRSALDHTAAFDEQKSGDQTAREIFCQVLGPSTRVHQNQVISTDAGESIDIAAAIANLLGFDDQVPTGLLSNFNSTGIKQAFL